MNRKQHGKQAIRSGWRAGSRFGWRLVTTAALTAAAAGAVLPVLPTVPFLLLAAWSAARHSPELEARLLANPRVGPHITAWRRNRALSRPAKKAALGALAVSLLLTLVTVPVFWVKLPVAVLLCGVAIYLGTRPGPVSP